MRVGYINYLNTYPLYWQLFERPEGDDEIELISDVPRALNDMMREGELDLSPVSVACLPEIQDDVYVLSDFCLGANGDVRSVLLLSQHPIAALDDRVIELTAASETSVVLLRYLLQNHYGVNPQYRSCMDKPAVGSEVPDAVLLIGNAALTADIAAYSYVYDLAGLWLEHTGMPFVFAVFVVRRDVARLNPMGVARLRDAFTCAIRDARQDKPAFMKRAACAYPDVNTDLDAYFESIKYDFTEPFKQGLRCYINVSAQAGLLGNVRELAYV